MNSLLLTDGYKTSHHRQYPNNTTLVYSNLTPRSNKHAPKGCEEIVVFGSKMVVQQIHEHFAENFFMTKERNSPLADSKRHMQAFKDGVINEIKEELSLYLGEDYDTTHFEELWDLGYLPISIKSLPEGTICPIKVPMFTIYNTDPRFYWLTNYLETLISNLLWKPITSASIALQYRKILTKYALETDKENVGFVDWQAHDFSMRGLSGVDSVASSGLGHATVFSGSDSLPVIHAARKYYGATGFVVGSVNATEHSVMCAGSKEDEVGTFSRLLDEFPNGVLSVVSDTWDLWNVITVILPQLKDKILAREGKLVIRPDSGDPVDILCGINIPEMKSLNDAPYYYRRFGVSDKSIFRVGTQIYKVILHDGNEFRCEPYMLQLSDKGVIELLWDIFGGTVNEQGYKVLDPHIGAIYGDSINLERAEQICERLKAKGFASTNVVLGVGSFTYQFNTRDTFGFAMKATYVEKTELEDYEYIGKSNGSPVYKTVGYPIFKDPITDDGVKKSAVGLLKVYQDLEGQIKLKDNCTWEEEDQGALQLIYRDGRFFNTTSLEKIRERIKNIT